MKKWQVIIILAISQFVMILDSTVMNVSISTVAHDLGTTISGMQAAITVYALTMAAFMLTGGKLGDKWGRRKAFVIGSIIYGLGSLITAFSPSLPVLFVGWSIIEGLGAILVIPAIAALTAINYKGKDRVVAFSILGATTGIAAAAGPLIGGFMTTYLSWRFVFMAETLIMIVAILVSKRITDTKVSGKTHIDIKSVILSAGGMALFVLGILQSKTWGWIKPLAIPKIGNYQIAPFGISLVSYLIIAGIVLLWVFARRQKKLEQLGEEPLLKISLLSITPLRSALSVLMSQYFAIAALFFVVPVYLQTVLGYDALKTGVKLIPLSIGLVIFSAAGSKATAKYNVRQIVRVGQLAISIGLFFVFASVQPDLKGTFFWIGMFITGAGFGLLASQLGNVSMSSVDKSDTAVVGGLQGTFQNLGSSMGTAIAGSVFVFMLTSGFVSSIQATTLPSSVKGAVTAQASTGVAIMSESQAEQLVLENGGTQSEADTISSAYEDAQLQALKQALFVVFVMSIFALMLSRDISSVTQKKS